MPSPKRLRAEAMYEAKEKKLPYPFGKLKEKTAMNRNRSVGVTIGTLKTRGCALTP